MIRRPGKAVYVKLYLHCNIQVGRVNFLVWTWNCQSLPLSRTRLWTAIDRQPDPLPVSNLRKWKGIVHGCPPDARGWIHVDWACGASSLEKQYFRRNRNVYVTLKGCHGPLVRTGKSKFRSNFQVSISLEIAVTEERELCGDFSWSDLLYKGSSRSSDKLKEKSYYLQCTAVHWSHYYIRERSWAMVATCLIPGFRTLIFKQFQISQYSS